MLADTLERLEFPATLPESLETQRDERAQADAITERIKASDEFQKLTPKQQKARERRALGPPRLGDDRTSGRAKRAARNERPRPPVLLFPFRKPERPARRSGEVRLERL
jgi:hypothetical protein